MGPSPFPYDSIDIKGGRLLFCTDFHFLQSESTELLIQLAQTLQSGDHLVLLGDLFESHLENHWACQEGFESFYRSLLDLNFKNIQTHLIIGNRDFMCGRQLTNHTRIQIHPNPILLHYQGQKLLALHGDELLPTDTSYQRFKRIIRHPLTLFLLRCLPLALQKKMAKKTRGISKDKIAKMENEHLPQPEILSPFVDLKSIDYVLAGHLHRDLSYDLGSQKAPCHILPDSRPDKIHYRTWDGSQLSQLRTFEG